MEQYQELKAKKLSLEKHISNGMDAFLSRNLHLDDDIEKLIAVKDPAVIYLCNFLIFGLLVQEGNSLSSAYTKTLSQYDTFIEKMIVKSMMKEKYFRKLNDTEIKNINIIRTLSK